MTIYAIPNSDGSFRYMGGDTTETFSLGKLSFPPPYLSSATPDDLAANGILAVVETAQPSPRHSSTIELVGGLPTRVWTLDKVQTIDGWQGRYVLQNTMMPDGKTTYEAAALAILATLPNAKLALAAYQGALTFSRANSTIIQVLAAIGLSEDQIDQLFATAAANVV